MLEETKLTTDYLATNNSLLRNKKGGFDFNTLLHFIFNRTKQFCPPKGQYQEYKIYFVVYYDYSTPNKILVNDKYVSYLHFNRRIVYSLTVR